MLHIRNAHWLPNDRLPSMLPYLPCQGRHIGSSCAMRQMLVFVSDFRTQSSGLSSVGWLDRQRTLRARGPPVSDRRRWAARRYECCTTCKFKSSGTSVEPFYTSARSVNRGRRCFTPAAVCMAGLFCVNALLRWLAIKRWFSICLQHFGDRIGWWSSLERDVATVSIRGAIRNFAAFNPRRVTVLSARRR